MSVEVGTDGNFDPDLKKLIIEELERLDLEKY